MPAESAREKTQPPATQPQPCAQPCSSHFVDTLLPLILKSHLLSSIYYRSRITIQLLESSNYNLSMAIQSNQTSANQGYLYLIGVGVTHSIAPPMHNAIAASLSKPWTFSALECPTIQDMFNVFHTPIFVGAIITMPYKQSVIPHPSGVDPHAALIGAVNNVYLTPNHKLRGTNTDWEGIKGCLLSADPDGNGPRKASFNHWRRRSKSSCGVRLKAGARHFNYLRAQSRRRRSRTACSQKRLLTETSSLNIIHITSTATKPSPSQNPST